MQDRGTYIMQDQVRDRVPSIMAWNTTHVHRQRTPLRHLLLAVALTVLYILALVVTE